MKHLINFILKLIVFCILLLVGDLLLICSLIMWDKKYIESLNEIVNNYWN
jgi:hypothetical protein